MNELNIENHRKHHELFLSFFFFFFLFLYMSYYLCFFCYHGLIEYGFIRSSAAYNRTIQLGYHYPRMLCFHYYTSYDAHAFDLRKRRKERKKRNTSRKVEMLTRQIQQDDSFSPIRHLLTPFAPSQPHRLSIFLQLRDQCISLLHHISVLLVLVVRSIRLDNTIDSVDCACDTVASNEFCKIPVKVATKVVGQFSISLDLLFPRSG